MGAALFDGNTPCSGQVEGEDDVLARGGRPAGHPRYRHRCPHRGPRRRRPRPPAAASTTALVDDAAGVVDRAAGRLRLSATHTVVAIAGATGSGKSSTFNALTGLELSAVGVRRPTTSWATACVWGRDGADELLEWLGIPPRHQTTRDSMLDSGRRDAAGRARRRRAARPARPRLHRGRPPPRGRPAGRPRRPAGLGPRPAEVRRRRDPRPLPRAVGRAAGRHARGAQPHRHRARGAPPVDARRRPPAARRRRPRPGAGAARSAPATGTGIPELRAEIARRAAEKQSTRARLDADIRAVAGRLDEASGDAPTRGRSSRPGRRARRRVRRGRRRARRRRRASSAPPGCAAAGRPAGRSSAGSPASRPTRSSALDLDLGADGRELSGRDPRRLPEATQVQRARVDDEVRALRRRRLRRAWRRRGSTPYAAPRSRGSTSSVTASTRRSADTDLGVARTAGVGRASCGCCSGCCCSPASAGSVWTGVLAGARHARRTRTPSQVGGVALALVLLVGGVVLGLLLGLVVPARRSRGMARRRAEARRRAAARGRSTR